MSENWKECPGADEYGTQEDVKICQEKECEGKSCFFFEKIARIKRKVILRLCDQRIILKMAWFFALNRCSLGIVIST